MADEGLVIVASYLRPDQAGMLRGLLESAGIVAFVRDDLGSAAIPFLGQMIDGVKVVVRAADQQRALDIAVGAGVLPGAVPEEPVEIPEDEWSRGDGSAGTGECVQPPGSSRLRATTRAWFAPSTRSWRWRLVIGALLLMALVLGFLG